MDKDALVKMRNALKKKKPSFKKHDSHKRKELPQKWRKPKGLHAKMRLGKKGYPRCVAVGFGSPKAVKGLTKDGMISVVISSVNDIQNIDPKTQVVVIAKNVGLRKKVDIVKKAIEAKLKISNLKKPEEFLNKVQAEIDKKRAEKKKALEKEKTKKKDAAPKKKPEEKLSEEDEKKAEKKEKDKLLTKKS
ncbi:MAG: 50S ribosomal protein L32e [bacterium]|nr:50S ribosomal protein L32e [bacterium]